MSMTVATIDQTLVETVERRWSLEALTRHEPALASVGLLMLAIMPPTLFAMLVDARTIQGVNVWMKPFKFEMALAVYVLTLVFFARYLSEGVRQRRWYRVYIGAVIAAIVLEVVWIGGAAAIGTSSHFNRTPIGDIIYSAMGAAAVLLTSASAVFAWQIARNRQTTLAPALKESVVIGLALVLPFTLLTAGTMSSMSSHFVGGSGAGVGGFPLMGWARDRGDLRVSHFFATHAMHFVPAFGLLSVAMFGGDERRPVRLFALAFVILVGFTFMQALAGNPFLPSIGG
ncbi:hypothetical protein [Mesorhizobium sp. CAU 1732]|uniref:hypothetical protein n=1 Tax=Mesorhizobium sp. CAU 1732 TaxID=3140358 RepID=UPI003260074E